MVEVYGLKNCDTCRRAVKWLEREKIAHIFHDLRKDAPAQAEIARWAGAVGWEVLLNKAGTTWRGLADDEKAALTQAKAVKLMAAHVALMKRPIFDLGDMVLVGFKQAQQTALKTRA